MEKKFLGVIAFAAIAAAAGWNYQQNTNKVQLSDLALENVEALALGETDDEFYEKNRLLCSMGKYNMSWKGREYPYICFIHKTLNKTIESVSRFDFLILSLLNIYLIL